MCVCVTDGTEIFRGWHWTSDTQPLYFLYFVLYCAYATGECKQAARLNQGAATEVDVIGSSS